MDRAVNQVPQRPASLPDAFVKRDGAPDVAFQGHEFFLFANDHQEFTPSGVIGNPMRASAEKGERTYERYADHLAAALKEFEGMQVDVHTRAWRAIV
jgi:creatinine amidohydrolase